MNIFKEIESDLGKKLPDSGSLIPWAEQGVLLLNTVMTVRAGLSNAHQKMGWETFTDEVISLISREKSDVVFLLWGSSAQKKAALIQSQKHLILQSAHPSPLSAFRGFFGNKHFSLTNQFLESKGLKAINW